MGGECFKRLKEAEGIVAAFLCSLVYTALLASNKQLQSLDWPYFFISGSAALLVSLFNLAHLWWRRLLHVPSDVKWVILRGSLGSTSNCLSVFAVLAGAHVGSIAALRSANSIVASLGTVALGEEFGWMHLVSVTLFVLGAVLTADPEEVLATLGSTLPPACTFGHPLHNVNRLGLLHSDKLYAWQWPGPGERHLQRLRLPHWKEGEGCPSFLSDHLQYVAHVDSVLDFALRSSSARRKLPIHGRSPPSEHNALALHSNDHALSSHLQLHRVSEMFRRCCHHRHHRYEHAARLWPGLFAVPASGTASDLCGRDSDLPGGANHAADASEAGFCQGQAACGRGDIESVAAGY
ncbi:unnamed protein product [Effrenium voratum]|nr:unnamed protein product [Effrenium voratum]